MMRSHLSNSHVVHALLLALPFLVVAVVTHGLSHMFSVYQGFDELHHFSAVRLAAQAWPRPLLSGYQSWSGPLVYWLLATLSRPFGTSLVAVRDVVMVVSWATCVTAYVILRDRLGARPVTALSLAAVLSLSAFFFGESFLVLTDNPTWLFVALAVERLLAYVQKPVLLRLAVFAAFAAAATLMRQVSVWLFLPALVAVASARVPLSRRLTAIAVLALGLVPLSALFVYWGGPVVSGGAPPPPPLEFRVRNTLMTLAVIGLWSALLMPAEEIRSLPGRLGRRGWVAVGVAVALSLGALGAHVLRSLGGLGGGDPYGMGIVGKLSQATRGPVDTSLSWWLLVPLGAAAMVVFVMRWRSPIDRVLVVALVGLILSAAANGTWYQRYIDFPVLLILASLAVTAHVGWRSVDRVRLIGLVIISALWTLLVALA